MRHAHDPIQWLPGGRLASAVLACALFLAAASPAAAGVAYTALDDGQWTLFYQDDPARAPVVLGDGLPPGDRSAPRLSFDGTRVAFEITGLGLFVCPVDSAAACAPVTATGRSAVRPAWLPGDRDLVFVDYEALASGEDSTISVTHDGLQDAGTLVRMTGVQDDPQVSPDGRWLLFTSGLTVGLQRAGVQVVQQLWLTDLRSGVSRLALAGTARDINPRWSPDGSRFAFASDRSGRFEIWVADRNGAGLRQVTHGAGSKTWPAWSPDGTELLFTLAREGRLSVWRIQVDGGDMQPLAGFEDGSDDQRRDADWR